MRTLAIIEQEIAAIQPEANRLLDQLQTLSRADARALKATHAWAVVEQWNDLLLERAKAREQAEIDDVIAHPERYND